MINFKAKVTSRGFLDKLKAHCVARGDLQVKSNDPEHLWSPCVFARTFKVFVAEAVRRNKVIKKNHVYYYSYQKNMPSCYLSMQNILMAQDCLKSLCMEWTL